MEVPSYEDYNFLGDPNWSLYLAKFTIPTEVNETLVTEKIKKKYYRTYIVSSLSQQHCGIMHLL